jgi:GR25 family glycosyltransferase involved in LPS biosynthesis
MLSACIVLSSLILSQPRVELGIPVSFGGRPTVLQVYEGQTAERAAHDYLTSMGYGAMSRLRKLIPDKSVPLVDAIAGRLPQIRRQGRQRPPFAQFVVPIGVDQDVRLVEMSPNDENVADVAAAFVDSMPQTAHLANVRELYVAEVAKTIERALNTTRNQQRHFKVPDADISPSTATCAVSDPNQAPVHTTVESHSSEVLLMRWLLQKEVPALPAYIINLWSSPYRLANLWQQCVAECMHEIQRFPAVDGVFLSEAVLQELFGRGVTRGEHGVDQQGLGVRSEGATSDGDDRRSMGHATGPSQLYDTGMAQGVIGCFASHLSVWHELQEQDAPFAIVLEDDVDLMPGFRMHLLSLLRELASRAEEFDVLYLDYTDEHWWPMTSTPVVHSEGTKAGKAGGDTRSSDAPEAGTGAAAGAAGAAGIEAGAATPPYREVHRTVKDCIAAVGASNLSFVRLGGVCSSGYSRGYIVTAAGAKSLIRHAAQDGGALPPHQPVDVFLQVLIADGRIRGLASARRLIKTHVHFEHDGSGAHSSSDMEGRSANTIFFRRDTGEAGFLLEDGGFAALSEV